MLNVILKHNNQKAQLNVNGVHTFGDVWMFIMMDIMTLKQFLH